MNILPESVKQLARTRAPFLSGTFNVTVNPVFAERFGATVYTGQSISVDVDGFTATATIYRNDDATAPWVREDGHGPVSEWAETHTKAPGELVIAKASRGERAHLYDFAEAVRIARRDGWGTSDGRQPGESARHYASRAAMADFERLCTWCADQWEYVGVDVTVSRRGVKLVDQYTHALWGIESDAGPYLSEVADELLCEALATARTRLATVAA